MAVNRGEMAYEFDHNYFKGGSQTVTERCKYPVSPLKKTCYKKCTLLSKVCLV